MVKTRLLRLVLSKSEEFWLTNVTKMDVMLGDLRVKVPSHSSINLLDSRHYNFTKEQLDKSAESGSIYIKRDKIKVRKVAPTKPFEAGNYMVSKDLITLPRHKKWSQHIIEEESYQELEISTHDMIDQLTKEED